jgi:hypothetical protein
VSSFGRDDAGFGGLEENKSGVLGLWRRMTIKRQKAKVIATAIAMAMAKAMATAKGEARPRATATAKAKAKAKAKAWGLSGALFTMEP